MTSISKCVEVIRILEGLSMLKTEFVLRAVPISKSSSPI